MILIIHQKNYLNKLYLSTSGYKNFTKLTVEINDYNVFKTYFLLFFGLLKNLIFIWIWNSYVDILLYREIILVINKIDGNWTFGSSAGSVLAVSIRWISQSYTGNPITVL